VPIIGITVVARNMISGSIEIISSSIGGPRRTSRENTEAPAPTSKIGSTLSILHLAKRPMEGVALVS
jgi:hypothetical protein